MAFAIARDSMQPSIYEKKVEAADVTDFTAGTVQDLGKKFAKFRLTVRSKTTAFPTFFALEIADDVGFSANPRRVIHCVTPASAVTVVGVGVDPLSSGAQFARVEASADSGGADYRIEAGD